MSVINPLNYGFVFVLAMMGGAFFSAMVPGSLSKAERSMPAWRNQPQLYRVTPCQN